jgi:tetratricopeptide (TPR) repeat protein
VLFLLISLSINAQSSAELKADSLALIGMDLMDEGEIAKAIDYLEQAKVIFPGKSTYDYEIGLAHYKGGAYDAALPVFRSLLKGADSQSLYYQMLGNTYDVLGKRKKAKKVYEEGLEKFPNSGPLYLESGVVAMSEEDYNLARYYWEKGIQADPTHASNYYWATKFFAGTSEKIWALLYGEIFLNLEFGTKRVDEISGLLFELYNEIYVAESDTSGSFDLTKTGFNISVDRLNLETLQANNFALLPFEGEFAMKYAMTVTVYSGGALDLEGIHEARTVFLQAWMDEEKNSQEKYPFVLFSYQAKLVEADYFRLYNYFLFKAGDMESFIAFYQEHDLEYDAFFEWYNEHNLDFANNNHARLNFE